MTHAVTQGHAQRYDRRAEERRTTLSGPCWPERRSGFDRRRRYPVSAFLSNNAAVLLALAVLLNVLNLLDLGFTAIALSEGAVEANPVMAWAFEQGIATAAFIKIVIMLVATAVFWLFRRYKRILQLAVATVAAYSLLAVYHVLGLALLL